MKNITELIEKKKVESIKLANQVNECQAQIEELIMKKKRLMQQVFEFNGAIETLKQLAQPTEPGKEPKE